MSILDKKYQITMTNGEVWQIPVNTIALDRAEYYAQKDYGGDLETSLNEDTEPLFESDPYEIFDWAMNNMNWTDVVQQAISVNGKDEYDYQEGWVNPTSKEIVA